MLLQIYTMRYSTFVFLIFLMFGFKSNAQQHQISGGMGVGSTTQILNGIAEFGSAFSSMFFNGAYSTNTRNTGEFRLSYAYTPKERWHFGGTFSYNHADADIYKTDEKIGDRHNDFYTFAGETSYSFLNKEKVKLYALVGAGVTFGTTSKTIYHPIETYTNSGTLFNFQISPFGIQFGKEWGGFAELGFGYRGLISFGMFYNL